ncbi:quinol monooxygenase YgiN [Bradyrhizobium sp. LB1.3]
MIYVIATTPMKPENKDDFIKGYKACTVETLKEKGCLSYDGSVSVNNPNQYVVVERWETRDDLTAHAKAPHMKVWREYSAQMKTAPTVIEIISDGNVEKL